MLYKLESLRGIAACIIIISHAPFLIGNMDVPHLDLAVDFFFILSGLVISLAYQERISQNLSFKSFAILRLGRLYPLHFLTLILWLVFSLLKLVMGVDLAFNPSDNLQTFISNILLVHSLGIHNTLSWNFPSWSISTEFFTYLIFYLLLKSIDKKLKPYIPIFISVICYCLLIKFNKLTIASTYDYGFIRCIGGFYLGVLIYRIKSNPKFKLKGNITMYEISAFLIPVLLVIFSPGYSDWYDMFFIIGFVFIVFVFSEKKDGALVKILYHNLFRQIGKYSYSIYLIHVLIILMFEAILKYAFEVVPTSIHGFTSIILNLSIGLITIYISKYSYEYVESPYRIKAKNFVKKNSKIIKEQN